MAVGTGRRADASLMAASAAWPRPGRRQPIKLVAVFAPGDSVDQVARGAPRAL